MARVLGSITCAGLHHVSGHRTVRASFRDYAWFTRQACLFLGMLEAPFIQRRHMPWTLRGAGLVLIVAGGAVAAAGYTTLGESHSAWSTPERRSAPGDDRNLSFRPPSDLPRL